jgi:hypothetical protein
MIRGIRSKTSRGKKGLSKKSKMAKKTKKANNNNKQYRGGAVYGFDLTDKIGGQPANIPLNGTQDGDCPSKGDLDVGFANYGLKGGKRGKRSRSKSKSKSKSRSKSKSKSRSKSRSRKH